MLWKICCLRLASPCKKIVTFRDYSATSNFFFDYPLPFSPKFIFFTLASPNGETLKGLVPIKMKVYPFGQTSKMAYLNFQELSKRKGEFTVKFEWSLCFQNSKIEIGSFLFLGYLNYLWLSRDISGYPRLSLSVTACK